jgi:hypothetical protein
MEQAFEFWCRKEAERIRKRLALVTPEQWAELALRREVKKAKQAEARAAKRAGVQTVRNALAEPQSSK